MSRRALVLSFLRDVGLHLMPDRLQSRLLLFTICSSAMAAYGQPIDVRDTRPMSCSFATPVEYIESLSGSAHELAWRDTVQRGDFFEVRVRAEYIDLIDALKRSARVTEISRPLHSLGGLALALTGIAAESVNRTNYFFLYDNHQVLLTRWRFVADGARLCFPTDKINYVDGGARGTIALSRPMASNSRRALWKFRWLAPDEQIQYELYVEDQMNLAGDFSRTAPEIKVLSKIAVEAIESR